jgi:glutaredoxin-related protein
MTIQNTAEMTTKKQLKKWIDSAPVVVFKSPVTEMDALRRILTDRNILFREVELSMGNHQAREQFHQLKKMTHYNLLPQIFIASKFIGGADKSLHSAEFEALSTTSTSIKNTKKLVLLLGYAGIIPFIGFSLLAFFPDVHHWAIRANIVYGGIILTFIGAVHWGCLLDNFSSSLSSKNKIILMVSVLPSLLAWLVLIDYFNSVSSLCILISGFMAMSAFEISLVTYNSSWYRKMRLQLSYTVSAILALSVLSTLLVL